MAGSKKGRQAAKNQRSGKAKIQYQRTISRTGKWRGKKPYEYKTYHRKKKKLITHYENK